jgi:hypothetical protein
MIFKSILSPTTMSFPTPTPSFLPPLHTLIPNLLRINIIRRFHLPLIIITIIPFTFLPILAAAAAAALLLDSCLVPFANMSAIVVFGDPHAHGDISGHGAEFHFSLDLFFGLGPGGGVGFEFISRFFRKGGERGRGVRFWFFFYVGVDFDDRLGGGWC